LVLAPRPKAFQGWAKRLRPSTLKQRLSMMSLTTEFNALSKNIDELKGYY